MPEISRFYGIVIKMFYNDHPPPCFHAEYGEDEIVVNINTLAVIAGKLAPRATGLVMEWAPNTKPICKIRGFGRSTWNRWTESIHCCKT